MNIPQKTLSLLAIASLFTFSSLSAVETDPVGYLTFSAADAADTKFGLPMEQALPCSPPQLTVSHQALFLSA